MKERYIIIYKWLGGQIEGDSFESYSRAIEEAKRVCALNGKDWGYVVRAI